MNYSDKELEAINNLNFIVVTDIYDNEVNIDKTKIINEYNQSVGIVLNLIQKQEKIIDYSIDRILPSPEEYLEIKNIMKQNKWGYDRSKKEYFKKVVDEDVKD